MTPTMISLEGSTTALSTTKRRHLMTYYRGLIKRWDRNYTRCPGVGVSVRSEELSLAEQATILRAILAGHIHGQEPSSPVEAFLLHANLTEETLQKLVRAGRHIRHEKTAKLLLQQERLAPVDRLIGLAQSLGYHSYALLESKLIEKDELRLVDGVANHWGRYCYQPLPVKLAEQIVALTSGQREIFVAFLEDNSCDMWDHGPRQKAFRGYLRVAQTI